MNPAGARGDFTEGNEGNEERQRLPSARNLRRTAWRAGSSDAKGQALEDKAVFTLFRRGGAGCLSGESVIIIGPFRDSFRVIATFKAQHERQ